MYQRYSARADYDPDGTILSVPRESWGDISDGSSGSCNVHDTETAWPNFDGPTDDSTLTGSQSIQTSVQERLRSDAAIPPSVSLLRSARDRGATVADRIHAFNSTAHQAIQQPDALKHDLVRQPHGPPSPNLARRMNPFVRRDATGTAVESPTPKPPQIHAPVPRRRSTLLARAGKPATTRDTPRDNKVAVNAKPGFGQRSSRHFERGPHIALAKIPGQQAEFSCTRHGRRLRLKRLKIPTTEGLAKSLSGGATLLPEPCPDCLAEENIRQREEFTRHDPPPSSPSEEQHEILSTITEPGTPVHENMTGPTVIGTFQDNQAVLLPGTAVGLAADGNDPAFVASDLGDMIDAIIIEHRGTLNKVITNIRQGLPDKVRMERMSQELSMVSDRFKEVGSPKFDIADVSEGRYSVILDAPPDFVQTRTTSVADVIDYVHSAAKDLGIKLPVRDLKSGGSSEETEVDTRESRDVPLDKAAAILRDRAAGKSVAPCGATDSSSLPGQNDGPGLPSSEEAVQGATSPLLLAVNVPEAMARSMPVPMIGMESIMQKDFVTLPEDLPRSAADVHLDPAANGSAPSDAGVRTDGSSEQSPKPLTNAPPRSQPQRAREKSLTGRRQAPWAKAPSMSGSSDASEARQAVHETETGGKSHAGAAQPSIKAQDRDAAAKERAKRRARLSIGSAKTARL